MGNTSFFKSIPYQGFLEELIPNFDTDTSKFKPSSTVLLWHNIVAKMFLDNCAKFYLEHNWWSYLDPIPSNILPEKNSHFSAFSSILLRFFFYAYTLTINSAGSVSKTSDTWWQYRYSPLTRKCRQYRYLVSVSCPSLPPVRWELIRPRNVISVYIVSNNERSYHW